MHGIQKGRYEGHSQQQTEQKKKSYEKMKHYNSALVYSPTTNFTISDNKKDRTNLYRNKFELILLNIY